MALPTTVPSAPSMLGADDAAKQEYFQALQKTLDALEARANQGPNMYQVAGALFNPGRTGNVGEAIGNVANVVGAQQERQQDMQIPLSQMKMQIAGQKYEVENQAKALQLLSQAIGAPVDVVTQQLSDGTLPPQALSKITPELYMKISVLSPKVAEIVKNVHSMGTEDRKIFESQRADASKQAGMVSETPGVEKLIPPQFRLVNPQQNALAAPPPAVAPTVAPTVAPPANPVVTPMTNVSPMSAIPVDKMKQALVDNAMAKNSAPSAAPSAPVSPPPASMMLSSSDIAPVPNAYQNARTGTVPDVKIAQNVANTASAFSPQVSLKGEAEIARKRVEESDKPWVAKRDEIINYTPQLLEQSNSNLRNLDFLATKYPDVFALMQKQGVIAGIARAAQEGAQLSVGDYSVRAGLPVQQFLENVTLPPEKQQAVRDINRVLASEFLSNVKANKGLLGVNPTDNDARLLQAPMASIQDSSKAVQLWARNQLLLNKQRGSLYDAYQEHLDRVGPTAPPSSFFKRNSLYDKINKDYSDYRTQLFKQFNQ
jgi:hypothetical protein